MKSVLMSIQPKWCDLIAKGKKTIEVRKTAPTIATPFKCYIYCTKAKNFFSVGGGLYFARDELYRLPTGEIKFGDSFELAGNWSGQYGADNFYNGKVIGEFVCDKVHLRNCDLHDYDTITLEELSEQSCVSEDSLLEYADRGYLYGWHISDIVIYDKPKPLNDFTKPYGTIVKAFDSQYIQRPPQSWCYVEELQCTNGK